MKTQSEKDRFGSGTRRDGSTIAWSVLNGGKLLSCAKAKKIGSWKDVFVGGDEGKGGIFLFVNKLKCRVLKME